MRVREKIPTESVPGLAAAEARAKARLGSRSRVLMRYSGTEKLARIMVEGEDERVVSEVAQDLASYFDKI